MSFKILLLLLNFILVAVYSQEMPMAKDKYLINLEFVINELSKNKLVKLAMIERTIPTSKKEYNVYYASTFPERNDDFVLAFYQLDSLIFLNAKYNKMNFAKKVIRMADFVDGEYAESYYFNLDDIVKLNTHCFCSEYRKLSSDSKDRLKEMYIEHCK